MAKGKKLGTHGMIESSREVDKKTSKQVVKKTGKIRPAYTPTEKVTIYIEPGIYEALRTKAFHENKKLSHVCEDALREYLKQ